MSMFKTCAKAIFWLCVLARGLNTGRLRVYRFDFAARRHSYTRDPCWERSASDEMGPGGHQVLMCRQPSGMNVPMMLRSAMAEATALIARAPPTKLSTAPAIRIFHPGHLPLQTTSYNNFRPQRDAARRFATS